MLHIIKSFISEQILYTVEKTNCQ